VLPSGSAPPAAVSACYTRVSHHSRRRASQVLNAVSARRCSSSNVSPHACYSVHLYFFMNHYDVHVAPRALAVLDSDLCAPLLYFISSFLALAAHFPPFHYPCPCNLRPAVLDQSSTRALRVSVLAEHRNETFTSCRCNQLMLAALGRIERCVSNARRRLHSDPVQDCLDQRCGHRLDTHAQCSLI
jgi:hypothetical protein